MTLNFVFCRSGQLHLMNYAMVFGNGLPPKKNTVNLLVQGLIDLALPTH